MLLYAYTIPNSPVMLRSPGIIFIVAVLIVTVLHNGTIVRSAHFCGYSSKTSTCPGDRVEIRYPFWIENRTSDQYGDCTSYPGFQVNCSANGRPVINLSNHLYYVMGTYYRGVSGGGDGGGLLSVVDVDINMRQECPQPLRNISNYTALKSGFLSDWDYHRATVDLYWDYPVNCDNCELSGGNCWANETNITTTPFHCNCPRSPTVVDNICGGSYYDSYYYGLEVGGISTRLKLIIGGSVGAGGVLLVLLLVIYRKYCYSLYNSIASSCRRIIKGPTKAEVFLESYGGLSLQTYKYSDIKIMTNSFKDTLGQGGFGTVFKGKLHNGQLVAVKVLNESKGEGDDFINEVASIGRTNHVNVVSLLGFCSENNKQALVYEFMPNGSLEKFIYSGKESSTASPLLGLEKLYQITLGIARGLGYLHRGCNPRILHFDIKPHNILLDQDFCPKISDFGLAKLCLTKESIVSMAGARGTVGYIAPEVYCANFGGVSHKSDVYSYGMMVLEMIGGRKNIDMTVESTSKIYFPQWIYKRLRGNIQVEGSENNEVSISGEVFEEIAQKMIRVALWCIQAHPRDRPSMTKVVEMLEGNIEELQIPPNPFLNLGVEF